ncbi:putative ankyrin repeat protein RF_0381 [Bradysia coprophila]|uniref:putative ankyrin repeat protein RF_0381 n=1 Tax=Bradysia coprophila TaxID=38358 RepID=UPI00187DCE9F|nr:putative ankyrin repeat protein RF_0381 [Bradysia coprophila]XP_037040780.1 putative ankyrin repeat protein RF_0381 [Bradysia coprophila]
MSKILYKCHKQIDNPLHKAAFRGKVDKIQSLLNDFSPYKATSESETPLHLSITKGHLDAANVFLSILEIDLTAVRRFLSDRKVDVGLGNENFACAIGKRQIQMVKQKCSEMIVKTKDGESSVFDNCTLVLMKENIFSVPKVLVVRSNNQQQKFVLLSTVFQLLNENGVISLNVQRSSDRSTVLHCAAAGGYTELVMRLLDLGANPHLKDIVHQTAIGAAHSMGEFHTYVEMCRRLRLDMFATKDFVKLPVNNAVWENVQFLIETLVALRMENFQEDRNKAVRTVLSMREVAETFLLSNVGEKCLETYGEHLSEKNVAKILMLLLNHSPALRSDIIMRHILQDCSIVKAKTGRVIHCRAHNTVLHILVRTGRSDIVRKIYEDFPHLKTILFEHKELGLNALTQCIQSNHVELAQFLIEEHENEINRPEQWSQLLITAAELPDSTDFMKMILEHRMTDPNLALRGVPSVHRNALFVCIAKGNLEKIKVILESNKLTNLNRIQSEYETLLQSAICSMNVSEAPLGGYFNGNTDQFKYLTNDLSTSEDEDVPLDYHPTETLNDNATKYEIMNKIFDLLIEKGANVKHVDASHKTLLHHAVAKSNRYVVERLLSLGLDPIDPDRDGNLPLHYVSNSEIFEILRNHPTFEETLTARNKVGATFLHNYARCSSCSVDLISKLIDNGVDVNAVDNTDNTPLHYMARPPIAVCELLINNNANIDLKNSQGLTATHTAISHENFGLAALLIKQPTFNLFALTKTGKSYLTVLTRIHADKFNEIRTALETRKDELIQLIEMYCNEVDDYGFSNLLHSTDNKYLLDLLIAQPHIQVNAATCTHNDSLLHRVRNDVKFARFLVDKGLDVNRIDPFQRTPLIQALTAGHGANIEVIRYLIEAGANVNCSMERGISPLRVACEYFHLESIRILLEAGADCNVKGSDGKIPFECLPIEYMSIVTNIVVDS